MAKTRLEQENVMHVSLHRGLSARDVETSRLEHGHNVLTQPVRVPLWKQFLQKFDDPLIKILLVALLMSMGLAVYEYCYIEPKAETLIEPIGILLAIVLATLVGFVVEVNAARKFELLNKTNDDIAVKVRRDGHVTQVRRRDVVVGDIVLLDTGEKVPADGILFAGYNLAVNESSLTGEPETWKSHDENDEDHACAYPRNVLLRGSNVIEGSGEMLVTRVGDNTEYGRVFRSSQEQTDTKTPLQLQLEQLGGVIARISYFIALLVVVGRVVSYFVRGDASHIDYADFDYMIKTVMLAVTLVVVSVPEGLPMSITLSLALSMRKLLHHNNLVRHLHACETMGAVTVICTDKTGTLTQNQMQVAHYRFYNLLPMSEDAQVNVPSPGSRPTHRLSLDKPEHEVVAISLACNSTAHLDYSDPGRLRAIGNPTEGALLLWLQASGLNYEAVRDQYDVVSQLPFSTERKFMATVVSRKSDGKRWLLVKGAYEVISRYCDHVINREFTFERVQDRLVHYQIKAMRTLAFAVMEMAAADKDPINVKEDRLECPDRMALLGIVAISDPVRPDVAAAVADCQQAGIKVKIVTGDNAITAREIGRQVGITIDERNADEEVVTGPQFSSLPPSIVAARAAKIKIMSRARPQDKARLVQVLQNSQHEVVAVTGDGTNDAPALNAAQVGLSMGDGTSVAKEASDITILDNSFASINKAVLWGRSLYRNIQRFIIFQLTVNVCACLVVALGSFLSMQPVLTVTQMLWVNLIMDTLAALALASLPPNSVVMREKPRGLGQNIITGEMKWFILAFGLIFTAVMLGLYVYMHSYDISTGAPTASMSDPIPDYEVSIFFTTFVMLQFWNLFNARMFGTGHHLWWHNWRHSKFFFGVVLIILLGQVLIVEFLGDLFGCKPIGWQWWLLIAAVTSSVMLFGVAYHWFKRRTMPTTLSGVESRMMKI